MSCFNPISNLINVDHIQILKDIFEASTISDLATFVQGDFIQVVNELTKLQTYPAVCLIEPLEMKYDDWINSNFQKKGEVFLLITAPTNVRDWSNEEIHTNTLSVLENISFEYMKSLYNFGKHIDIRQSEVKSKTKSFSIYQLAGKIGKEEVQIFDKNSAVELKFNLIIKSKFN